MDTGEGTLSTSSYNRKEDIFLTNGLYTLAVLHCSEHTENSVWGLYLVCVSHFLFIVTSCVGEMREASVRDIFGRYKVVSMFPSLGHIFCVRRPFPLSVSPPLLFMSACVRVSLYTLDSQCLCFHRPPLRLRDSGNHSYGFSD